MHCPRCRNVLVDQDEVGWYYQIPLIDPRVPQFVFMDRVHECYGKPHLVVESTATPEDRR